MAISRITLAAAAAGLAAIVSGAFITSAKVALQPSQPEPEAGIHRSLALIAIAGVCAALAIRKSSRLPMSLALASLIACAAVGWTHPLSPAAAVWHAAFAHLFTASIAVSLILGSARNLPAPIPAGSWSALRPAAIASPAAVFAQIAMGALYRHQLTGVMPHMLGAMIVALLTMVVAVVLLQNFSQSVELGRTAAWLMAAVLLQICLGITVFILLLLNLADSAAFVWIATAHVTTGTLVLAASIFTAMEVSRRISVAT